MKLSRALLPALCLAALVLCACGTARPMSDEPPAPSDPAEHAEHQVPGATIYTHTFTRERNNTATGDFYLPAHRYPELAVDQKYKHVLSFQMTPFMPPRREALAGNGPLILFSDEMDVLVFSPLDHFYVSLIDFRGGRLRSGIEGDVTAIPAGFAHRFVVVRGRGMAATIARWGEILRATTGKQLPDRYADTGLSYLGYWTDNGAFYYYNPPPDTTYEDVLLAVKRDADQRGIPFRYFQIDSWWYRKRPGAPWFGGTVRWEPLPEAFPRGLEKFRQDLGLPLIAHSRWFAPDHGYLGEYQFVPGERMALPVERRFYDHLLGNARQWGIETFEQDWLTTQYWGVRWLRSGLDHADHWVKIMDDAAADSGRTMQICMAHGGFLMDAVNRRSWTTMRTSIDYRHSVSKESFWPHFHTVNMLAHAVGLWPFKDNFQCAEKHGEAEALISILSAGMVGPSDELGRADAALLARTCRADGLLLKPDRPAFPIDAMFLPHARPYTTYTESRRADGGRWLYLAAYHLARRHPRRTTLDRLWARASYDFREPGRFFVFPDRVTDWQVDLARDLGVSGPVVAYDWRTRRAALVERTLALPATEDLYGFAYFVLAPVSANGLALLGETEKFVTLADRRFDRIETGDNGFRVSVRGVPGETVTLRAYDTRAGALLPPASATIGADGVAAVELRRP